MQVENSTLELFVNNLLSAWTYYSPCTFTYQAACSKVLRSLVIQKWSGMCPLLAQPLSEIIENGIMLDDHYLLTLFLLTSIGSKHNNGWSSFHLNGTDWGEMVSKVHFHHFFIYKVWKAWNTNVGFLLAFLWKGHLNKVNRLLLHAVLHAQPIWNCCGARAKNGTSVRELGMLVFGMLNMFYEGVHISIYS